MHSTQTRLSASRLLFTLMILITLSGSFIAFFYIKIKGNQIFPISTIKIASDYHRISKIHLKKTITSHIEKENFLTLNITTLKEKLMTIPWVYNVVIHREWPGTLLIKIEEQKPTALFNSKGILNQNGEIFYPPSLTIPSGLPQITCNENDLKTILQYYQQMATLLKPFTIKIKKLEYSFDGNLKVALNNNVKVLLGKTDILRRWKRFISASPRLFQEASIHQARIEQVDSRYSNGLAVRWTSNTSDNKIAPHEEIIKLPELPHALPTTPKDENAQ